MLVDKPLDFARYHFRACAAATLARRHRAGVPAIHSQTQHPTPNGHRAATEFAGRIASPGFRRPVPETG
jgi:hypothetical protein